MIKQVYDNRVNEILDNLKTRIIKEPFGEDIGPLIDNYVKISNVQIRSLEVTQKRDFEVLKKLEKDLEYYRKQEKDLSFIANESVAHKEYKTIVKYLENFLNEAEIENNNRNIEAIQSLLDNFKIKVIH